MVLESLTDNADKANPMGIEAPYSDWQMSGEDLVDYQDKDSRGLSFVFSVERMSDNEAMRKFVSVYQKPSDDNTGAYVVVSTSPNNINDIRVYEISNTTYGNEPEDPKIFLQKVIEMADGTGMLRTDTYEGYGILETAEDFKGTPVMDGKGGSSGTAAPTYKSQANRGSQTTVKGSPVVGQQKNSNLKTYGNKTAPDQQAGVNKNLANAGFTAPAKQGGLFGAIKNASQHAANRMGEIYKTYAPESQTGQLVKKTSSMVTNSVMTHSGGDENKQNAYAQIHDITVDSIAGPHKPKTFEQPLKNGKESTTEQLKKKSSDGLAKTEKPRSDAEPKPQSDSDWAQQELGVKPKKYANPLMKAVGGVAGGVVDALSKTQQGGQVGLHPIDDATRAADRAKKSNASEDKRYEKDLVRANKENDKTSKKKLPNEQEPAKAKKTKKKVAANDIAARIDNHNTTGVWK